MKTMDENKTWVFSKREDQYQCFINKLLNDSSTLPIQYH